MEFSTQETNIPEISTQGISTPAKGEIILSIRSTQTKEVKGDKDYFRLDSFTDAPTTPTASATWSTPAALPVPASAAPATVRPETGASRSVVRVSTTVIAGWGRPAITSPELVTAIHSTTTTTTVMSVYDGMVGVERKEVLMVLRLASFLFVFLQ